MPTFKEKKSGGYYILAKGRSNPVNTFQIHSQGVSLVLGAGIEPGDELPWDLFYFLDDLGQLYFKGEDDVGGQVPDPSTLDGVALEELTSKQRLDIVKSVLEEYDFENVQYDTFLNWILSLRDADPSEVITIVAKILGPTGIPPDLDFEEWHPIEFALCHYYFSRMMVDEGLVAELPEANERDLLAVDDGVAYFLVESDDWGSIANFALPQVMPDVVSESTDWMTLLYSGGFELFHRAAFERWVSGQGLVGVALADFVEHSGSCLVLPESAVELMPTSEPVPNELSEHYDVFLNVKKVVEAIIDSDKTGVSFDQDSPMLAWYGSLASYVDGDTDEDGGYEGLGAQQKTRNPFTMGEYRSRFGDGETVTKFSHIETAEIEESLKMQLIAFGIIRPGERIIVPVAPESNEPIPLFPHSDVELQRAQERLKEFPAQPAAAHASKHTMTERLRI